MFHKVDLLKLENLDKDITQGRKMLHQIEQEEKDPHLAHLIIVELKILFNH
ncbi:hypothetical protein D3C80_2237720 [compost metagenome]